MINYNPRSWFRLIFSTYSRHVMRTLLPAVFIMAVLSIGVDYLLIEVLDIDHARYKPSSDMHALLGVVLGLFLVFRTNSAYDRWWEGRKLWGSFVNNTRNLAHKLNAYLPAQDETERQWFAMMIANLVVSTKDYLRNESGVANLAVPDDQFLLRMRAVEHIPNRISSMLYERVTALYQAGVFSGDQLLLIDRELKEFSDIIGACERIKTTPIPYSYSMYLKQFIFIYIITLPFAFVTKVGYGSVFIVALITFVLLGVELIAEEIEDPFGRELNDLPTDELAVKITTNVREILLTQVSLPGR